MSGADCGGQPCWRRKGDGYEYRDRPRSSESSPLVQLKPGLNGRSRLRFRVRGSGLTLPALPMSGPVTVQLQRPRADACFGSTFAAPFLRNEAKRFRGRVP